MAEESGELGGILDDVAVAAIGMEPHVEVRQLRGHGSAEGPLLGVDDFGVVRPLLVGFQKPLFEVARGIVCIVPRQGDAFDHGVVAVVQVQDGLDEDHAPVLLGKHLHQTLHKVLGEPVSVPPGNNLTLISSQVGSSASNEVRRCSPGTIRQCPGTNSELLGSAR